MQAALLEAEPKSAVDPGGLAPHQSFVEILAERIALHIESLVPRGRARCLEIGGGDLGVAEAIHDRLARTDWRCVDAQPVSFGLRHEPRRSEHRAFDGETIPYGDHEFDVAVLCDVLHQAPEQAARLLSEAARVARYVLVKDRFADGPYSRAMLRLTDLACNWGGNVQRRYLTRDTFIGLAGEQGLVITAFDCGLMSSDSNFVAALCRGLQ